MNDFTSWLYAHYIKPYLDQCSRTGYETALDLRNDLVPYQNEALDRAVEFYASRAFLLGVRTGAGLKSSFESPSHGLRRDSPFNKGGGPAEGWRGDSGAKRR